MKILAQLLLVRSNVLNIEIRPLNTKILLSNGNYEKTIFIFFNWVILFLMNFFFNLNFINLAFGIINLGFININRINLIFVYNMILLLF